MGATAPASRVKGYLIQVLVIISINVPTVSFGLALGWVSLASGAGGAGAAVSDGSLVGAAAATFLAGLAGVPLAARALALGRKCALLATSAAFVACWTLKLCGGAAAVAAARLCAGVGGAAAWCVAPLYAAEMTSAALRGAAAAAPVLAHNLGFLIMYAAADARIQHSVVLWCCLSLSVVHCVAFLFAPESPAFLAATGEYKRARAELARARGTHAGDPALEGELRALPPAAAARVGCRASYDLVKDLFGDRARRRAFVISCVCVVGQEMCGVLTLMQFAERVLAGGAGGARGALVLGAVQLAASGVGLYLIERVGRRALVVWGAVVTALGLAGGAAGAHWGRARLSAGALAVAVAADSAALQPAPYAVLSDMFHYQYRGAAVLLVTAAGCAGNAAETLAFPALAAAGGLPLALAVSAALTLLLAAYAARALPETAGATVHQIYCTLDPARGGHEPEEVKSDDDDTDRPPGVVTVSSVVSERDASDSARAVSDSDRTNCPSTITILALETVCTKL